MLVFQREALARLASTNCLLIIGTGLGTEFLLVNYLSAHVNRKHLVLLVNADETMVGKLNLAFENEGRVQKAVHILDSSFSQLERLEFPNLDQ